MGHAASRADAVIRLVQISKPHSPHHKSTDIRPGLGQKTRNIAAKSKPRSRHPAPRQHHYVPRKSQIPIASLVDRGFVLRGLSYACGARNSPRKRKGGFHHPKNESGRSTSLNDSSRRRPVDVRAKNFHEARRVSELFEPELAIQTVRVRPQEEKAPPTLQILVPHDAPHWRPGAPSAKHAVSGKPGMTRGVNCLLRFHYFKISNNALRIKFMERCYTRQRVQTVQEIYVGVLSRRVHEVSLLEICDFILE